MTAWWNRHYLGVRAPSEAKLGKPRWTPCRAGLARAQLQRYGCVVFPDWGVPRTLRGDALAIPPFVDLCVDLLEAPERWALSLPRSAQQDLRKVRQRGFRVEFSCDAGWIPEFLARYHLPTVRLRHGEVGYVSEEQEIATEFATGQAEWVKVFQGETCVAANYCRIEGERYELRRAGWLDGDSAAMADGGAAALYWFCVNRAWKRGLRIVHWGGVAPFLDDGLFAYKSKWGGRVTLPTTESPPFQVLLNPAHPGVQAFFKCRSLVVRTPGQGVMVLSGQVPEAVPVARSQAPRLQAWLRLRATPAAEVDPATAPLPACLRPWFEPCAVSGV